jgi:hypothetical protein
MQAVQHEMHEILTKAKELLDRVQRGTAEGRILRKIRRRPRAAGLFPDSRQLPPIGLPAAHAQDQCKPGRRCELLVPFSIYSPDPLETCQQALKSRSSAQMARSGCRRSHDFHRYVYKYFGSFSVIRPEPSDPLLLLPGAADPF